MVGFAVGSWLSCWDVGVWAVLGLFCAARRTIGCCGGLRCGEVGVWGLFCAAKRTIGCCGWFRCGEGAFIVGDGFRFGCFVLWLVVGEFCGLWLVVCGW